MILGATYIRCLRNIKEIPLKVLNLWNFWDVHAQQNWHGLTGPHFTYMSWVGKTKAEIWFSIVFLYGYLSFIPAENLVKLAWLISSQQGLAVVHSGYWCIHGKGGRCCHTHWYSHLFWTIEKNLIIMVLQAFLLWKSILNTNDNINNN